MVKTFKQDHEYSLVVFVVMDPSGMSSSTREEANKLGVLETKDCLALADYLISKQS